MSVFERFKKEDYSGEINKFDPSDASSMQMKIVKEYQTPSRHYIKKSARGIGFESVSIETLQYIITSCHQCSQKEKYHAILIVIYKLYLENTDDEELIIEAKNEMVECISIDTKPTIQDLSYLNDLTKDYDGGFLYVIKITIGLNTIFKYGITDNQPRKRFTQIKSDICSNYSKQKVSIKPLYIVHSSSSKDIEDDIKSLLSENNIKCTNYDFSGKSEAFNMSSNDIKINDIILSAIEKYKHVVLYDST